ncbi:MAG: NAD-dependent epimerase/dehydratase family protein [Burkholderiaceae bacterium]
MAQYLITGASGWIARALAQELIGTGHSVWGLTRRAHSVGEGIQEWVHTPPDFEDLDKAWPLDRRFDAVVHLAARVHSPPVGRDDEEISYRSSNSTATLRVAKLARERGVQRFVFLSSVKALGEKDPGRPLREDDLACPEDAYGRSKLEAEEGLRALEGIETVILRPPLVYGPGVRANFFRLMAAIERGWPLPLGCAQAQRSLIYLDNLVDALVRALGDVRARGRLYHVADAETLSVRDLLLFIGQQLQRPARLVPVPLSFLRGAGRLLGYEAEVGRLTESLRLDTTLIRSELDWSPPLSAQTGLARTAAWFKTSC